MLSGHRGVVDRFVALRVGGLPVECELADPIREPRASAVMLRALASLDKPEAAKVACEGLGKTPLDTNNAKGSPEEIDRPRRNRHEGRTVDHGPDARCE